VIDFIQGKTVLKVLGDLEMTHERYVDEVLPRLLVEILDCFSGIVGLHDRGLCHGDIRNDHLILDSQDGRARWLDFDFVRASLVFDVWTMGNVLNCVLAKGFVTFHGLRQSRPDVRDRVDGRDASAFFRHRVMNVDRLFPYLPPCFAAMLRRFCAGATVRYERAEQIASDLGACLDGLGWLRARRAEKGER
jgi:hypothetical protein